MSDVPYALAHQRAGLPPQGVGRATYGLLLRGLVIAVHLPDGGGGDEYPFLPAAQPGVLCDVMVLEPRYRTVLRGVPVMTGSAGVDNHEVWVPQAATATLTGEPLTLTREGSGVPTVAAHDTNGDIVIIAFLENDTSQPVIIGQLPHPRTNRRPSTHDTPTYRYRRHAQGIAIGVTESGDATVDTTQASGGAVSVSLRPGSVLTVDAGGTAERLTRESFLDAIDALIGLLPAALAEAATGVSGPAIAALGAQVTTMQSLISASKTNGAPYLTSSAKVE